MLFHSTYRGPSYPQANPPSAPAVLSTATGPRCWLRKWRASCGILLKLRCHLGWGVPLGCRSAEMVEVHRPFCKKWCFQDRSSCGLRIQLEKTTTSHYQKIAILQYLLSWNNVFLPSPCRYQLGAGGFCSSGLLRCTKEEGDEENQAGDGDIEQKVVKLPMLGWLSRSFGVI